jgi:hypothetical protein
MRTIETTIYTFDELSDEAKERAISQHRQCVEYPWFSECLDSLNAFCDEFNVKVTDYTLSDCHMASISTDATPKHFRGVKLSGFDREAMPTGFCFDCDLRYTFHDEFKRTGDAFYAFNDALQTFLISVRKDIEWHYSDEAITEYLEINNYEFTEEGDMA